MQPAAVFDLVKNTVIYGYAGYGAASCHHARDHHHDRKAAVMGAVYYLAQYILTEVLMKAARPFAAVTTAQILLVMDVAAILALRYFKWIGDKGTFALGSYAALRFAFHTI